MSDAVRYLKLKNHGSMTKVAQATGYRSETLRALAALRELPAEVQNLIKERKLGYEAHKILSIRDALKRIDVGHAMVGLNTNDIHALVEYVNNNTELSVDVCKQRVLESKTEKKKVFMVVAEISEESYMKLKTKATKNNVSVDELVRIIVNEWLEAH